jgi:hypothetical protein
MIWHNKHQISNQIKENCMFYKNRMFRFTKPDGLVFGRCRVLKFILLNLIQQNWKARFQKSEVPEFLEVQTI